jgi:hypothetical protein
MERVEVGPREELPPISIDALRRAASYRLAQSLPYSAASVYMTLLCCDDDEHRAVAVLAAAARTPLPYVLSEVLELLDPGGLKRQGS